MLHVVAIAILYNSMAWQPGQHDSMHGTQLKYCSWESYNTTHYTWHVPEYTCTYCMSVCLSVCIELLIYRYTCTMEEWLDIACVRLWTTGSKVFAYWFFVCQVHQRACRVAKTKQGHFRRFPFSCPTFPWIFLSSTSLQPISLNFPCPSPSKHLKMPKKFTKADVAKHNTEKDCFLIIGDKVYDVTKFLGDHPVSQW